jgi:hypothetical protein
MADGMAMVDGMVGAMAAEVMAAGTEEATADGMATVTITITITDMDAVKTST